MCHGSPILSADLVGQLNHAHKSRLTLSFVWHPLYSNITNAYHTNTTITLHIAHEASRPIAVFFKDKAKATIVLFMSCPQGQRQSLRSPFMPAARLMHTTYIRQQPASAVGLLSVCHFQHQPENQVRQGTSPIQSPSPEI